MPLFVCMYFSFCTWKSHSKALSERIEAHGHGLLLFHTQRELLIQKNRGFDFTECECVFINIYTLLWRCVVLRRPLRWQGPCPRRLTRQTTQWITLAKKGHRRGERGKETTESKRKGICFMKELFFTKHGHQVIWFPLAFILDLFFTLFYYVL